jgi:kynurenine formamidase
MPVYPGDPAIRFAPHSTVAEGGFAVTRVESGTHTGTHLEMGRRRGRGRGRLSFGTHTGTHVDAPAHVQEGAAGVDGLPLEVLVGPARVIDASHRGAGETILAADLGDELPAEGRVLLRTDWDQRFGEADCFERFPALSRGAVERLVAARVRLLGLETPSVNAGEELTIHQRLLDSGIMIVEGLVGLRRLPAEVWLVVAPLPLRGLDGAPCRVFAFPGALPPCDATNGQPG